MSDKPALTKYEPLNEWLEVVGHPTIGEGFSYTYELESCIDDIVADQRKQGWREATANLIAWCRNWGSLRNFAAAGSGMHTGMAPLDLSQGATLPAKKLIHALEVVFGATEERVKGQLEEKDRRIAELEKRNGELADARAEVVVQRNGYFRRIAELEASLEEHRQELQRVGRRMVELERDQQLHRIALVKAKDDGRREVVEWCRENMMSLAGGGFLLKRLEDEYPMYTAPTRSPDVSKESKNVDNEDAP